MAITAMADQTVIYNTKYIQWVCRPYWYCPTLWST